MNKLNKMIKANKEVNTFLNDLLSNDIDTLDILRQCKSRENLEVLLKHLTLNEINDILTNFNDTNKIQN